MNKPSKHLKTMGHIDFPVNYFQRLKLLFGIRLPVALFLLLYYPYGSIPALSAEEGGWYLEGPPIIEKSRFVDNEFYFGQKLSISDGSASGTVNWSDGSSWTKCGGTYVGSVTWTPPPSFMLPGSKINFSMTAKTTVNNTCGSRSIDSFGWIKAEGVTIVKALEERSPSAGGTYTVPPGSPGRKMQMWATVKVANLNGSVTYNYVFKGAASVTTKPVTPATSPGDPPPGPLTDKLPKAVAPNYAITLVESGPIYVSADSPDLPPSQRKWVKIMPGRDEVGINAKRFLVPIDKNWSIRTPRGSRVILTHKTTSFIELQEKTWWDNIEKPRPPIGETIKNEAIILGRMLQGVYHMWSNDWKPESIIEQENSYVGVHGTDFVVEVSDKTDTVKVIDGVVELTSKATGEVITLRPGEKATATSKGLGQKVIFDAAVEKKQRAGFYQYVQEKTTLK